MAGKNLAALDHGKKYIIFIFGYISHISLYKFAIAISAKTAGFIFN